jgi:bacterioferritin-associated ferredoxin
VLLFYLWVHWVVTGKLMIICICNRVSERDIDNAVIEGASSMCQLNERLRVGTGCGACVEHVRDCLNRCLADDLANMGTQQA